MKKNTQKSSLSSPITKESFSAIVKNIPDLIWIKDKNGTYLGCNKRFEEFFGAKESQIIGKTDYDFVEKEQADFFTKHDKEALSTGKPVVNYEELTFASDGHKEYIHVTKTLLYDEHNTFIGILGVGRDITKEKETQENLEKTLNRLELAINSTKDGVWDWDPVTNKVYFSDNWKFMLGFKSEEISDDLEEWSSRVHPDDINKVMEKLNNHLEKRSELYESTHRLKCKDGSWKWVLDRGKAQFDNSGKVARVIGYHTDLTQQKKNEKKLEDALLNIQKDKIKYQTLMESSSDAIMVLNKSGKIIEFSQEAKKLLGYSDVEMKSLTPYDWDIGLKKEQITEVINDKSSKIIEFETKHKRKDGSIYDAFVRGITIVIEEEEYLYSSVKDITEQKQNQKKLEQITKELEKDRAKYKTLMENSSEAIFIIDDQGFVIESSKQFKELLGYTDKEVYKLHVSDFEGTHTKEEIDQNIHKNFSYEPVSFESKYRKKDGTLIDVSLNIIKIKISGVDYFYCSFRDISDIKKYEKKLKHQRERLELAQSSASIGIWELDLTNNNFHTDDKTLEIFERTAQDFDGSKASWAKMLDEDELKRVDKARQEAILYDKPYKIEYKINLKTGGFKYVKVTGTIIKDDNNNPIRLIGTVIDNTEERVKNNKIKEQKEEFELIFNNSKDSIAITDLETNFLNCNEEYCKMTGYTKEEMLQTSCFALGVPEDREKIQALMEDFFKVGVIKDFEKKCIRKDGTEIIANMSLTLLPDKKRILINAKDISAKKEYERTLKEQKEEFEAIFTNSKDGIAIIDLESNFLDCNDAYLEMMEYTKEELLQESCISLTIPEEREDSMEALNMGLKYGYLKNYEKTCLTKNGRKIKINMTASLLPDQKRFLIVTKDMTLVKLLDEQSRLAAMGEMIGNIAHQWRQPLSVISASASALELRLEYEEQIDKQSIQKTTDRIIRQVEYLSDTIDDFRNFIKGGNTYKEISLKESISKTFNLIAPSLKNNFISLKEELENDLTIIGNKNELQQALINIINNAKDALKENIEDEDDRFIFVKTKMLDDHSLELTIKDSGGGIPEDVIGRIFEPYFTTKDEKTGTGIGLSMVDKIIRERHSAELNVSNQEYTYEGTRYKGAMFRIVFHSNID